jgi:hypothetical protein
MYFFHCEETKPFVSIFTYIEAMLLNLEAPVTQQTKRKFVNHYYIDRCELWGFIREINSGIFTCENIIFFPTGTTFT